MSGNSITIVVVMPITRERPVLAKSSVDVAPPPRYLNVTPVRSVWLALTRRPVTAVVPIAELVSMNSDIIWPGNIAPAVAVGAASAGELVASLRHSPFPANVRTPSSLDASFDSVASKNIAYAPIHWRIELSPNHSV